MALTTTELAGRMSADAFARLTVDADRYLEPDEPETNRMMYVFLGKSREVEVVKQVGTASLVYDADDIVRGEFWVYTRNLRPIPGIEEGSEVLLRAKVARANREQALIGFDSMEGPYSIRVPLSELRLA